MRRATWIRSAILMGWLGVMAWLIRYEAFPEYFTHEMAGYRGLLPDDVLVHDSWMRIRIRGNPVGYSHTSIETEEANPLRYYTVQNRTAVRLAMMGVSQTLYVDTTAYIDPGHLLQEFAFSLSSRTYQMEIGGRREDEETFAVTLRTPQGTRRLKMAIPRDTIIYSPLTEMALKRLKPGQDLSIRTLDPASLTSATMTIRALRHETVRSGGREVKATVLQAEFQGTTAQTWMTEDGTVLKQDTPMGWTLEACTPEEAFATMRADTNTVDVLTEFAIPCDGDIARPREAQRLRLKLKGVAFADGHLDSARQKVTRRGEREFDLEIRASTRPGRVRAAGTLPAAEAEKALAATPFIQTGDPALRAAVRRVTGGATNPVDVARALYTWVHRNVRKEMTASLPSALDVLKAMEGDCNEHTYLMVGLARTAGIPAKVMVGVVYQNGAFYYHAWPALFLGEWIEMDPTWGQEAVDATHIRLVEGELADQMQLVNIVGQLRISVVEDG